MPDKMTGHFEALPDILRPCQTFFPVDDWRILVVVLVFLVGHFMCIDPCWIKCPARSELSVGHQQTYARHVRHVWHTSRSHQKHQATTTLFGVIIFTFYFISSLSALAAIVHLDGPCS